MIVHFYHGPSTMMELRWLRSFLAVADEMHLSRAARKLHLAQPALTTQIQQLERFLGSSLFQRSNRISDLTAAGQGLLPKARAIVERAEALPGIVEKAARGETGRLRLGDYPTSRDQPTRGMFENHFFGVARHGSHGTTGKPGRFNQRAHPAWAGSGDR